MTLVPVRVGTARWNIPLDPQLRTDPRRKREGTLASYATVLSASEVNSSFYRHHDAATWARWARTTPAHFRFSL
ncbi:MAG: hypothetical protein JWM98_2011, partial [Thermoleophilia bacterium]|nr:hypothetical protein [Thermoleophilia bacterium]